MKKYLVGGYVRDLLLGIESKDLDYLVICDSFVEMRQNLKLEGIRIFQEREEFGIIRGKYAGEVVDFILAEDFEDDILRRDFTINALALDENKDVIDLVNGKKDLKAGVIRAVTAKSIPNDPIRIIRALRFKLKFDFELDPKLEKQIKEYKEDLMKINSDRIRQELQKFLEVDVSESLELLHKYNLLDIFDRKNITLKTGVCHK